MVRPSGPVLGGLLGWSSTPNPHTTTMHPILGQLRSRTT
jgi:hypothetical protein